MNDANKKSWVEDVIVEIESSFQLQGSDGPKSGAIGRADPSDTKRAQLLLDL